MVEFPGLGGIQLSISREAIRNLFGIEGFSIYWYGIIIALGFLLAVLLAMKNSKRFGLEPDNILDMIIFAAPMAIIGARLYYVIFSWDLFRDNPIDILNTRKGGLAIYGGVIFGILTAYVFCKIKKIKPLKLIDFGVPYLVMAQGIGRWGNFFNQEAFGVQTNLPWRMNGDVINQYLLGVNPSIDLSLFGVHPTFLYESIWDIAVFIFLLWFRNHKNRDGEALCMYMMAYGFGRIFIEGLRTDSLMVGSLGMRVSQVLAVVFFLVFFIIFIALRKKACIDEASAEIDAGVAAAAEGTIQSVYSGIISKIKEETAEEEAAKREALKEHGEDEEADMEKESESAAVEEADAEAEAEADESTEPESDDKTGEKTEEKTAETQEDN